MLNSHGHTEADLTVSMVESGEGSPHAPSFEGGMLNFVSITSIGNYLLFHKIMVSLILPQSVVST